MDIIFAEGKFRAKSKFANIAKISSTRKIKLVLYIFHAVQSYLTIVQSEHFLTYLVKTTRKFKNMVLGRLWLCVSVSHQLRKEHFFSLRSIIGKIRVSRIRHWIVDRLLSNSAVLCARRKNLPPVERPGTVLRGAMTTLWVNIMSDRISLLRFCL